MKKIIILCFLVISVIACNESKKSSYIETYIESILTKYPNFASNDIAKKALEDSLKTHSKSFIGKATPDIKDITFDFDEIIDRGDKHGAIFKTSIYPSIEINSTKAKYVSPIVGLCVFVVVTDDIAATLDANKKYRISGILTDWDSSDFSYSTTDDISLGTYMIDNAKIEEVKE